MFAVTQLAENTFYYEAFTNVGIYRLDKERALLIDSCDHKRMVRGLDRELEAMGLKVDTVINTHCHADHIMGNSYFKDKYGARLLSTKAEQGFIYNTGIEADFYNAGLTLNKSANPFCCAESTETEIITKENIPAGFEIISLPGHCFDMIGVRTPDDVVFLADSVLSFSTWRNYKYPFFHDVNKAIKTLEEIKQMKAALFVPSHNSPVKDITDLAEYNIEKLTEKKRLIYDNCEGKSFEELFAVIMERENLELKTQQYAMYAAMIRNLLKALIEDDVICSKLENNVMIYHKK